jgi:UDP-glucose 4-epimerase
MTYIVTGGAGFIGSMVCRKLVERGRDVVAIDNLRNGRQEFLAGLEPKVKILTLDIRDAGAVRAAVKDIRPAAVCHLAAIHFIPYCNQHPQETIDVNITGTLNVLEACRESPPQMVVIASSAAVYGISDEPNRETEPPLPMDIYGTTKRCDEDLGRLYSAQTQAPCIAARIFNAVGPNETNPHLVPHLIDQLKSGERRISLGNLDPYRDYIDTRDLAEALIGLLHHPSAGFDTFNIGTSREYSVRDVIGICEQVLGRAIEVAQRPDLVRKTERMHLCACIDKIRRATGWTPRIDLPQTLRELLTT